MPVNGAKRSRHASIHRFLLTLASCVSSGGLLAQEAVIPYKSSGVEDPASQFLDVVLVAGLLMGVAAFLIAMYRKRMIKNGSIPGEKADYIQVLDRKVLSTRLTAHVLSVDGRKILVCESQQNAALLEISGTQDTELAKE